LKSRIIKRPIQHTAVSSAGPRMGSVVINQVLSPVEETESR